MTTTSVATLKLVKESKIRDLLPDVEKGERFEASGVLAKGSEYLVVFDNLTAFARNTSDIRAGNSNELLGTAPIKCGYEGSAYNAEKNAITC